jgi:hypothetical protein
LLAGASKRFIDIEATLNLVLKLMHSVEDNYMKAPETLRRMMNQAFFEKIYVGHYEGENISIQRKEIAEPFASVLAANRHLAIDNGSNKAKNETQGLALGNNGLFWPKVLMSLKWWSISGSNR